MTAPHGEKKAFGSKLSRVPWSVIPSTSVDPYHAKNQGVLDDLFTVTQGEHPRVPEYGTTRQIIHDDPRGQFHETWVESDYAAGKKWPFLSPQARGMDESRVTITLTRAEL